MNTEDQSTELEVIALDSGRTTRCIEIVYDGRGRFQIVDTPRPRADGTPSRAYVTSFRAGDLPALKRAIAAFEERERERQLARPVRQKVARDNFHERVYRQPGVPRGRTEPTPAKGGR